MKEKYHYLLKNTGLFMISNFASKFLVFFLVPFYTNILTTEEYGSYDLIYSTVQLLLPILSLNIIDSVMRFSIGAEKHEQKTVFSVGTKYLSVSFVIVIFAALVCSNLLHMELMEQYGLEFVLLYAAFALNQITGQFARGLDDVNGVAVCGVMATGILIFCNLVFLLFLHIGLRGYFYAYILSFFLPAVYLFFRDKMYLYIDRGLLHRVPMEKEILLYSLPLMFNTISWSINSVADHYAVTWICGLDANGLYAVAYKVPAILQAVSGVFIQAWQLSSIREFKNSDDMEFHRTVYKGCQLVMIFLCACLIFGTRILARILYAKEFFHAWVYVPTLLLYIVFNTLSGIIGGVFSAVKETKAFAKSAIVGASVNIVLNVVLIYLCGIEGAAIATLISSIVIWQMRLHYAKKYIDYQVNKFTEITLLGLLFLQAAIMSLMPTILGYGLQIIIIACIGIMTYVRLKKLCKRG